MNSKIETASYIVGAILCIAVLMAFIAWRAGYTLPESEHEIITVTSKEKLDDGMECFGTEFHKSCRPRFIYRVNGQRATEALFNSVEEGKIYSCRRSIFGGWDKCEEVENELGPSN